MKRDTLREAGEGGIETEKGAIPTLWPGDYHAHCSAGGLGSSTAIPQVQPPSVQ